APRLSLALRDLAREARYAGDVQRARRRERLPGNGAGPCSGTGFAGVWPGDAHPGGEWGCTQQSATSGPRRGGVWGSVRRWSERVFAYEREAGGESSRVPVGRILFWVCLTVCGSDFRERYRGTRLNVQF